MSKAAQRREALLRLLEEHRRDGALPTSGRFLFYELVARGIISKTPTGKRRADQDMTEALTQLRENGDVPWDWIVVKPGAWKVIGGLPQSPKACWID